MQARLVLSVLVGSLLILSTGGADPVRAVASQTEVAAATNAKIWVGRQQEIEEFLKTAQIVRMEDIGLGVTKPKKAYLAPGGPVEAMTWKAIKPGTYSGYYESYKSEIVAYELDKLLGLEMIPPTVERRIDNQLGAAVMWASPVKSFKDLGGAPVPPGSRVMAWNKQIVRTKMFDNLIYNKDPNLGNWLLDPDWNLILIDHTRSFTPGKTMAHELTRIDRVLWDRMKSLTEESMTTTLGPWLGQREIRGIVERRDKMQELIDKLVATKGEAAIFLP